MQNVPKGIPRPLVKNNQAFIVISVILTWLTGQHWILALPLFAGLLGLLFGYNPIIKLAAKFLTKERSHYVLEDWSQQQFNQSIAVFCLTGGLISFHRGVDDCCLYFHSASCSGSHCCDTWFLHRMFYPLSVENVQLQT